MNEGLSEAQLAAIRPYADRLRTQGSPEDSTSRDGALILEDVSLFLGAAKVHVWQLGEAITVDIVEPGGAVQSVAIDPQLLNPA